MLRRELLQQLTGLLLSSPVLAGLEGKKLFNDQRKSFTKDLSSLLADIGDVIVPPTTTPGAKAAGAHLFAERVLRDCTPKTDFDTTLKGLETFEENCKANFGKTFAELKIESKNAALKELTINNKTLFLRIKELIITGYFTSEIGATQALAYLPIPGEFKACVPLQANQKTWALN